MGEIEKLETLKQISSEIVEILAKLNTFPHQKITVLRSISFNKWFFLTFNKPARFVDKLIARKLRFFVASCGENLMRLLIKLDNVISEGNEEIKIERKSLVSEINEKVLPLADEYLVQAQALVTFGNKIQRTIDSIEKKSNEDDGSGNKNNSGKEKRELPINDYNKAKKKNVDQDFVDDRNNENGKEANFGSSESNAKVISEPQFDIQELTEAVLIKVTLPETEKVSNLSVSLSPDKRELILSGNMFSQPFKLNPLKYNIEKTRAKKISEKNLIISVPKITKNSGRVQVFPPRTSSAENEFDTVPGTATSDSYYPTFGNIRPGNVINPGNTFGNSMYNRPNPYFQQQRRRNPFFGW